MKKDLTIMLALKANRCLLLLASLLFIGKMSFSQDININLNSPRQTVDGVGFCHEGDRQNGNYYVISPAIQQMLDNKMSLFRDMFPNKIWEPSKNVFNYTDARVVNSMQRLKTMQDRGIKTILGIWDVPNWLVTNPSSGDNRHINNFDDFAWFITSYLVHGKNTYGLKVDYVDVNETRTSGINISMTAQEYITLIQKCQTLFTQNGIETKMNMGSVLLWDIQYCKDIYNATSGLSVAGFPSWHTYRGGSTTGREPISYWEGWGAWRQTIDRNLWGTETDYDAYYWLNADRLTWQGVEEMAVMYYRNYYVARMSTSAGWFWHPEWPSNNVHTAYMNHFEPGGQIVETSQPNADVMTVAYKHTGKQKFVIQTVNQASAARTVTFHGVPSGKSLTLVRTSEAGDRSATVGTFTPTGSDLTVTLQANSFNTFYGDLGSGTDLHAPSVPANFNSTGKTSTTISLAWTASTDNVGVAGYQVFNSSNTLLGSSSGTSVTLQSLTPSTSYTMVVKAYDAAGNFSAASNSITVVTNATGSGPATVYADCNYGGTAVSLPVGNYTMAQLQALGVVNDDISSVQVQSGYTLTLYADNNFAGSSLVKTANDDCLVDDNFNDLTSSIRVAAIPTNLAYNKPASASSVESATYSADKAVDMNSGTRWSSSYANNQSIWVDLGASYNVNRVRLVWESAYAKDYQIQFSTNNTSWTTVREFWGKTSAAADDQTGLTGTARYVKVYCINRATAYGFSLIEFEVYGTAAGQGLTARGGSSTDIEKPIATDEINDVQVYPNPAKDQLNVRVPSSWQGKIKGVLTNAEGKTVLLKQLNSGSQVLNVSGLSAGIYTLQVSNGGKQVVRRVVIE